MAVQQGMSASAQAALRLRRLLAKQTQEVKEMEVELQDREAERLHLLQLLKYKEQILQQESFATERLRAALYSAKGCKQYYLMLCVLRSWRDATLRANSRRGLAQAKEQGVEVVLRHACGALAMGLRQLVNRRIADAMHELWLHAAAKRLQSPQEPNPAYCIASSDMFAGQVIDSDWALQSEEPYKLDEVAEYEALVARLHSELRWERSRREACDKALETLRGSYSLLLSRASAQKNILKV
ncbi:pkgB [Symbiodinium pilosum]|uniref:PkgB protein n=1 Tax=Symbiodinium pilosum TaxID=2952 RepID=A0A812TR68_SYMPI|nr:pkgB [Symbiodinium pilosum]